MGKPKGNDFDIFAGIGERITALNGFMYGVGWEKPLDLCVDWLIG